MDVLVVTLTIAAFILSAYFVLTWGWGITGAKRKGQPHITWVGVVDFAGLQVMVLLYTVLALIYFVTDGVPVAQDWNSIARRTVLYLLIVLVSGIRTFRWLLAQQPRWAMPLLRAYWNSRAAIQRSRSARVAARRHR